MSVPESGIDVDPVASDQPVGKPVATGKRDSGAFGRATSIFPPLFLEATMVAILILYALNFFLGKLRNEVRRTLLPCSLSWSLGSFHPALPF